MVARYEALQFFDQYQHMSLTDLKQLKAQVECLKQHGGRGCNAPRAYQPEVIGIALDLVEHSISLYEQKGKKAFEAFLLAEEQKSEKEMRAKGLGAQLMRLSKFRK